MEENLKDDAAEMSDLVSYIENQLEEATSSSKDVSLTTTNSCKHPGIIKTLCIKCGKIINDKIGTIPFQFLFDKLLLRPEEVNRLCNVDFVDIMNQKKLHLALDLDNTLLDSVALYALTPEDENLKKNMCPIDDSSSGSLFLVETKNWSRVIKLRPYVRTFLEEASKMYCLSIATRAGRNYALEMAKILDPSGRYFGKRVVAMDDLSRAMVTEKRKRLDAVLGHQRVILVLDDSLTVWRNYKQNLIWIERYKYFDEHLFSRKRKRKPLTELKCDEDDEKGALANALSVLKTVHREFFDSNRKDSFARRDVRKELAKAMKTGNSSYKLEPIKGVMRPLQQSPYSIMKIWINNMNWENMSRLEIIQHIKDFMCKAILALLAKCRIKEYLSAISGLKKEPKLQDSSSIV